MTKVLCLAEERWKMSPRIFDLFVAIILVRKCVILWWIWLEREEDEEGLLG